MICLNTLKIDINFYNKSTAFSKALEIFTEEITKDEVYIFLTIL